MSPAICYAHSVCYVCRILSLQERKFGHQFTSIWKVSEQQIPLQTV